MKTVQTAGLGTFAFVLCWFCFTQGAAAIQTDITSRAAAKLSDERFSNVQIETRGRKVMLLGTVPTAATRVKAEQSVRELLGVHSVINRLGLAVSEPRVRQQRLPYQLSISFSESNAVIAGLTPSEATRAAVIEVATDKYGVDHVVDRLQIEANTRPEWDAATKSIVGAMALLTEVDAKLTDVQVTVIGQAQTRPERERVIAAIRSAIPYGVALELNITANGV